MNPAPFQPPPGARLVRRRGAAILRRVGRIVGAWLLAIAILAVFAIGPQIERGLGVAIQEALR